MANEYTLNQPDLLKQFRFAQLPTEEELQRTTQARQESLLAQTMQKRLQKQQMQAEALKANSGGFANPQQQGGILGALAGLGNVAAGHRKANQNRVNTQGNEQRLAQSTALVDRAEQERQLRGEQNTIAEAGRQQYNTEQAAEQSRKQAALDRALKQQQMLQDQANADRKAQQEALKIRLDWGKEDPIRMFNPETKTTRTYWRSINDEGTKEGWRYLDENGEEHWKLTPPEGEGYLTADSPEPLTSKQRSDYKIDIPEKVKTNRTLLQNWSKFYELAEPYADGGKFEGQLPQVALGLIQDQMVKIINSGETEMLGELQAALSFSDTQGDSTTEGETKGKRNKPAQQSKGTTRTETTPKPGGGSITTGTKSDRIAALEELMEQQNRRMQRTERQLQTSSTYGKGQGEYDQESSVETDYNVAQMGDALLALDEDGYRLMSAMASILAQTMKENTGLEASAQIFRHNAKILGQTAEAPPWAMMMAMNDAYEVLVNDTEAKLEPYSQIGLNGGGTSVLEEYEALDSNVRNLYRMPAKWDSLRGTPGLRPGDVREKYKEQFGTGHQQRLLDDLSAPQIKPRGENTSPVRSVLNTVADDPAASWLPNSVRGAAKAARLLLRPVTGPDGPVNVPKAEQIQRKPTSYTEGVTTPVLPSARALAEGQGAVVPGQAPPAIALPKALQGKDGRPPLEAGEDAFIKWVTDNSGLTKGAAKAMYRKAMANQ